MVSPPTLLDIQQAHNRIGPFIHKTPVFTNSTLDAFTGGKLYFKCENFQKVGAFKFRGALNAVFSLNEQDAVNGVATHSSGNHAQALALAAKMRKIPAYIVMPHNAPQVKKAAVAGYGGKITYCEPALSAREGRLKELVEKTGATFLHPYDDARVIAGQGTAALELLEDCKTLDVIITPVGGGGLVSGTTIAAKTLHPAIRIIAAEPENADDAYRSLRDGRLYPSIHPTTIADGLLASLGKLPFAILQHYSVEVITATEETIKQAMQLVWERMKIIIEPSAAVALAVLLNGKLDISGKRVGIILSGGNVDLARALEILR